jgi:DNA polymerase-3 subunit gamma/tau
MLGDLLELTHTLTRLKSVPALRDGAELPEAERTRGAGLADRLTMPVLGRTWQMLLKGAQEVEQASDRRAAVEMVLIRLCYVADLPPPGELVRRLTETPGAATPAPAARGPAAPPPFDGGTTRAVANGPPARDPVPDPVPAPAPAGPQLSSFRDIAMLVAERREPVLHGLLLHSVHLVRFAPPVIELRPEPDAPRDLAPRLAALLLEATGTRWTIALSREAGEPTLASQGQAADTARRGEAALHPLVRAILDAFPGAKIASVTDSRADVYGLVDEAPMLESSASLEEGDGREFAPLDADDEDFVPSDAAEPI